jgi:hemoglobin/transferrin/lactoferrin receptor protein
MKKIIIAIAILFNINILNAQKTQTKSDTTSEKQLETVIISANKTAEDRRYVAQPIQVLTANRIAQLNTQTTADLLQQSGNVLVQRSQQGGGSPILRGFESSRVVLVIDGVRMNNLIYRSGHLQNVMTTDQSILQRLEILQGPASTVYGSDALGGVVHLYTKNPTLSDGGTKINGKAYARYGSANQEKTGHVDFNIGLKNFASLTSFTYSDFGDLRMGAKAQTLDTVWGLRHQYQQFINGKDSLVKNDDPFVQRFSGYKQYDVLQKFLYKSSENVSHILNFQASTTSDLPRYDRLTDPRGAGLNQGDWYYGPQKRLMAAYVLDMQNIVFFDGMKLNVNYQNVEESRFTRGFGSVNRTGRVEKVTVLGANLDFQKKVEAHQFRLGLDFQAGSVNSTAEAVNVVTGAVSPASTRYPDGDNTQVNSAIYATHTWKITDKLTLNDGVRLANVQQKSTFLSQSFFKFPFNEATQNVVDWSGNLGLIYQPKPILRLSILGSKGYRVPNIDDLTKVFDTRRGAVVVPNPSIKPEETYNLDLGMWLKIGDILTWENSFFMTAFQNAIVVDKFRFNGQDSIVYDGVKSVVLAPQNNRRANLIGYSTNIKAQITEGVTFNATFNYTRGRIAMPETSSKMSASKPLDHIPPIYGRAGIAYTTDKFDAEFFINANGWKRIADYNDEGEDNQQYATKDGMPSWWTMNIRAGYAFTENVKLQAGIENIADINYRVFASGIHASGRNVYATLRASF